MTELLKAHPEAFLALLGVLIGQMVPIFKMIFSGIKTIIKILIKNHKEKQLAIYETFEGHLNMFLREIYIEGDLLSAMASKDNPHAYCLDVDSWIKNYFQNLFTGAINAYTYFKDMEKCKECIQNEIYKLSVNGQPLKNRDNIITKICNEIYRFNKLYKRYIKLGYALNKIIRI